MKIIAGLGNPGAKYKNTRHNAGFMLVDYAAFSQGLSADKKKFKACYCEVFICGERVLLVKPQTFMNRSGDAVVAFLSYYKVEPHNLLVVYDDVDINFGTLRFRPFGSAGGHNGMKSVINEISTEQFPRLRIGIGPFDRSVSLEQFVLGNFTESETELLPEVISLGKEMLEEWVLGFLGDSVSKSVKRE